MEPDIAARPKTAGFFCIAVFVMAHLWLGGGLFGVLQATLVLPFPGSAALLAASGFAMLGRPVDLASPPDIPATSRVAAVA